MRKISIIMPVYNEKNTLKNILNKVEKAKVFNLDKEIILIDDCSTDGSREMLSGLGNKYKVLYHKNNQGKGAALKTGFQNATGDIMLIQDADLEYNPGEYQNLIKPILDGKADVVYGSRFMGGHPHRVLYYWHYVGNKLLTQMSNIFTNLNLTDMETCYKVFTKNIIDEIIPKLESKGFGFEPEITAKIAKLAKQDKCRIYEIGISYSGRTYKEGKKIGWNDGVDAIWCMIKYNIFK